MKQDRAISVWGVLLIIFIATPCLLMSSEIRYTLQSEPMNITFSKLADYDMVHMTGAIMMSELGRPILPVKSIKIAIPVGTKAISVEAKVLSSTILPGEFYVMPGQPPIPTNQDRTDLSIAPDSKIYGSTNAYPDHITILDQQSDLAGQPMVWVTVYPLQYVPAKKQLILNTQIELIVKYAPNTTSRNTAQEHYFKFSELQRRLYDDMIKNMVVNPENVHLNPPRCGPSLFLPPGDFDHVIITNSALAPYFQPLVYWHKKKGLNDTIITTDYIFANYSGPGDTLQVRQFVIDANSTWGTMYFLMAGEDEIVPFDFRTYSPGENTPSDQYYSDFDDDWTHEVYVGRAPVENAQEVNIFVNKVLSYEKNPPVSNYPLEVLLVGMDLDASSLGENFKETFTNYLPGNMNVNRVYDSYGGNHLDSTIHYLNAGMNLVNHCDHCNMTIIGTGDFHHGWGMVAPHVDNLTNNGKLCTFVTVGCDPNAMDYEDCIAEHFIIYNDSQAGVAFVGNTRVGWYYVGNPGALSGELDIAWFEGLFTQNKYDQGQALIYSKHDFFTGSDNTRKHCEWTFNLQGEPAMPIWTNTPDILLVTHPLIVRAQSGNFAVTVMDNDGVTPINNALVCCWVQNQTPAMYVTGYTNSSGQVTLAVAPNHPGDTMDVTVTKPNYLAHEGISLVTVTSGPFLLNSSNVIDDNGGNGLANPGENIDLGIWTLNIGLSQANGVYGLLSITDPYVTLNIDSAWYGNIPNFDSALATPDYDFDIANTCPDGHVIQLNFALHDANANTWTYQPEIMVFSPILTYQNYTVVSSNNILDPGETADFYVTIMNEGTGVAQNVTSTLICSSPDITINDGSGNFGTIDTSTTVDNSSDPYNVTASVLIPFSTPIDLSVIVQCGVYVDTLDFTLTVGQLVPSDTGYYNAYYVGGPYAQTPIYNWYAIDTTQTTHPGTSLNLDINQTVVINLPFTFKYYGVNYSRISISSNGWIAMDSAGSTDYSNTGIPNADGPPAMIAGIWDYLDPGNVGAPSDIYYYYDAPNHRFVVEYFRVEHNPSGNQETFEIILCDPAYYPTPTGDGEILVQYPSGILLPGGVTVGIENEVETIGIQYFFNGTYDSLAVPITSSFAIKYTTKDPSLGVAEYQGVNAIPIKTMLTALFPNPFRHQTNIQYQLSQASKVDLIVYDISGRIVRNLKSAVCNPGYYITNWDGKDNWGRTAPIGIYFVRFETNEYQKVEKAVLLK